MMTENPGGQQSRRDAQGPLPARSAREVQLWLDLHPCECGATRPRGSQELRVRDDGGLMSVYAGACPGCGCQWSAAFSLPASQPPEGRIGGVEPSAIIDPGEWLWLSDQDADVPVGGGLLSPEDRARLGRAADELGEVVKFIPSGHDRVPDVAFTSSVGHAMRDAFPGRFLETELRSRAQMYRAGTQQDRGRHPRGRTS